MRNKLIFCVVFITALILLVAVSTGALRRSDPKNDVIGYNMLLEQRFEGSVAGKGNIVDGLMYFPLKTPDTVWDVQIGPKEFVDRSGFRPRIGDIVTVIGMPVHTGERDVILAREIAGTNCVFIVRDHEGLPLWETGKPLQMDPEHNKSIPEVCSLVE